MSRFDDDVPEMSAPDSVQNFLGEMRRLAEGVAPEPSAELSAVLSGAMPLPAAPRRLRDVSLPQRRVRRHPLLTAAAVAILAIALLVTGAATHHLPAYAQRLVSRVVNTVTPFHIDPGSRDHPVRPGPVTRSARPHGPRRSPRPARGPSHSGARTSPSAPTPSLPTAPSTPITTSTPTAPVSSGPSTSPVRTSVAPTRTSPGSSRRVSTPASSPVRTTPADGEGAVPGRHGKGHAYGVTAHPSHGNGNGSGNGNGATAHASATAGVHGGGHHPAPSPSASGRSGKHESVQERVAETLRGVVARGEGRKVGQSGIVPAHLGRGHHEHLAPVRTGVERG